MTDIISVAIAYTSVSTALNQNESVNVNAKLPTKALPSMACPCALESVSIEPIMFLSNNVIDQNINKIVNALETALIIFISHPICEGSVEKIEKNAPSI